MRRTPRRVPPEKRVRPAYTGDRESFNIRLRPAELAELRRRAAGAGTTVSEYVRGRALADRDAGFAAGDAAARDYVAGLCQRTAERALPGTTGDGVWTAGILLATQIRALPIPPPAGDAGVAHKENNNA